MDDRLESQGTQYQEYKLTVVDPEMQSSIITMTLYIPSYNQTQWDATKRNHSTLWIKSMVHKHYKIFRSKKKKIYKMSKVQKLIYSFIVFPLYSYH